MDRNKVLKVWELSALVSLSICLCAAVWAQGKQESISSGLVRLHVLAVSDEEAEQAVKLRVRDAVLDYLSPKLSGAESVRDAESILRQELSGVYTAAESAADGRSVTVSFGTEHYPAREYGEFTLPAGKYNSLRIVLGEGEGHNWWCIVFPPVCLSAVEPEQLRETMSPDDYALITAQDGWELRFRAVELWGELTEKWDSLSLRPDADSARSGSHG